MSPPEELRSVFAPVLKKTPILQASLLLLPTAYPSGNPSLATTLLHLPLDVVIDASAPPSSNPPASQIFPPPVEIEALELM
jgi:hypothetical protein